MNLPYFSRRLVDRLRGAADANTSNYGADAAWVSTFAGTDRFDLESQQVVGPPPMLLGGADAEDHDAENAKRLWDWLGQLPHALAMEERLWARLAHVEFAEYMYDRWGADKASKVHRRYLFEDRTFAALARNGIARLWWGAALTHDSKREHPFELTETLFLRQDIQVSLLERSLGKCGSVRTAVLDFLRENHSWFGAKSFGDRVQDLLKELNLLGGVVVLDAMVPDRLAGHLLRTAERIAGSKPSAA